MLELVGNPETKRQKAAKPGNLTIRIPEDLDDELESFRLRGLGSSAAIFLMARIFMDIKRELGPQWWDIERAAFEQRVGLGLILGRLVKTTLEGQQRKK
jgi:hypothetical protein